MKSRKTKKNIYLKSSDLQVGKKLWATDGERKERAEIVSRGEEGEFLSVEVRVTSENGTTFMYYQRTKKGYKRIKELPSVRMVEFDFRARPPKTKYERLFAIPGWTW